MKKRIAKKQNKGYKSLSKNQLVRESRTQWESIKRLRGLLGNMTREKNEQEEYNEALRKNIVVSVKRFKQEKADLATKNLEAARTIEELRTINANIFEEKEILKSELEQLKEKGFKNTLKRVFSL